MVHTIFSLSIPSAYLISKLQGATLIGGRRLHEGGLFQRKKSQSYEISKLPLNYFKPKVKKAKSCSCIYSAFCCSFISCLCAGIIRGLLGGGR